jgi:predicted transcriptional regulator
LLENNDLPEHDALLEMTAEIVTSMVSNNSVSAQRLPDVIGSVYAALSGLGQAPETSAAESKLEPAVSIRKSLADEDVIISLIDGKPYKMLRRHIGIHGYTAETYRAAFGLKPDYPMVAPSYAAKRRGLAKKIGLGRKKASAAPVEVVADEPTAPPAAAAATAVDAPTGKKPRRSRKAGPSAKQSA